MSTVKASIYSKEVKRIAHSLGFDFCGISTAAFLEEEAPKLERWLNEGRHGTMQWMENYFEKRLDPRLLHEGTKSIISVRLNYFPEEEILSKGNIKISRYAYGEDYHNVLKNKLKSLLQELEKTIGDIEGRAFVDSAPVMDKAWAKKSGLGWLGKNTNLISKDQGSYFFLGELFVNVELEPDGPIKDYCGTCTRCIDACPTDALTGPYQIDGSKCISYLTIELKELIPNEFKNQMEQWAFGCDICQEVCPWNRFAQPTKIKEFTPSDELLYHKKNDFIEVTEEIFGSLFKLSPIKRTKYKGFKRSVDFITSQ
jgi:epoxyqueuosine reductase